MLLKFMSTDVFQSAILDDTTGDLAFRTKTHRPRRTRSGSQASNSSFASIRSLEKCPMASGSSEPHITLVEDAEGNIVADVTWEGDNAVLIRIGDECIKGTAELFDAAFMRILPDGVLMPTRMEYTWRLASDCLTLQNHIRSGAGSSLIPASAPRAGHDYVDLRALPEDEILEMLVCYLLLSSLRERMYSIKPQAYSHTRNQRTTQRQPLSLSTLRRHATRSVACLRNTFRRTVT
ncbi:uncharacterized protein LAESUDRAFT_517100 [Laetiporus sulphureus 93-53]|uniref:Uncharacterized protein n=1 Tax=Laetiporus sulphureus 93-53 TaxID=1314785 RepID=A0A165G1H1_9APHY|nr:uncharacterized protein LAESUDRAFT_517100 [Laetiporus sulphureus 93-53]KZT09702.1 hypothetical protein LAESUDRAFT_517100 [Laetiporus sulphureus 93-53]